MNRDPWQYVAVNNNPDGFSFQHALNNHNRCCDDGLTTPIAMIVGISSILFIIFLLLLSSPGFHPALDGLRLLSPCCLLIFSIYCGYCWCSSLFFFSFCFSYLFDSMPTSRCPIVFSRLGPMRVFFVGMD